MMMSSPSLADAAEDAMEEIDEEEEEGEIDETFEATEEDKRKTKVKEHLEEMIENTSFHGINYIVDERYPWRRVSWLVITVVAFIYSLLKVHESTMKYLEYPFTTSVTSRYVDEMVFPAISICNLNDMKLSVINGTQLDKAIIAANHSLLGNMTKEHYERLIKTSKHELPDMLVECVFDSKECSHLNFTKFAREQGDTCWTFNAGKEGQKLQSVAGSGIHRGLMVTINIEHYEFYRDRLPGGISLMIHGQDQTPVRIEGKMMPPGYSTYVKVDKQRILNLEAPYKTRCGKVKLKYFKEYSIDTCWLEQLTDFVEEKCKCKSTFMPGDTIPVCDGDHMPCVWYQWELFEEQRLWQDRCPLPCEMEVFGFSASSTLFPSQWYAKKLKEMMEEKFPKVRGQLSKAKDVTQFMRNNLVRLIIFYDNLSFEIHKQQPSYDFAFFLGDIGGQIGLFIGAGAMSYFELIDCLGMMFHSKFFEKF